MTLRIDLHAHTNRYSSCSLIDPSRLIVQAVKAGLDGLVITEHQRQWEPAELDALLAESGENGFLLLAGFEYTTTAGDLLIYGLTSSQAGQFFQPGLPPEEAVRRVLELGGACVAAHPTRAGMGFDERLLTIPVSAMEVLSVNMKDHERRLALNLAARTGIRAVASSDAHVLHDVGRYCTEFDAVIRTTTDLQEALRHGKFRVASFKEK